MTDPRRTVSWQQFADDVTRRGLHGWMLEECATYGVLLEEVFAEVGPHKGRRSVRHARARIFRRLVEVCMKSHDEVAEMFGVSARAVQWAVNNARLGYLAGEAPHMGPKSRRPEPIPEIDREEFMRR